MTIALIFVLAVLVEGIMEHGLLFIPSTYKPYAAMVLAIMVCLAYGADLLALAGLTARVPYAGEILTGLIIGRGSNYLNDLWERIKRDQRAVGSGWQS